MKLLAAADIHIGRRPAQIPADDAARYSCAEAWRCMVDYAVSEKVTAVLLAGDIVDEENKFFEALGPLEEGLRQLASHGIVTVAVAGNHDFDVLPGLTKTIGSEHLRLLGRAGWERTTITDPAGREEIHVLGWSFPTAHVDGSPFVTFPAADVSATIPTIGLVHADLGSGGSSYAPASTAEFDGTGVPFWVIGHVHKPGLQETASGTHILSTGSPQGMDPGIGETGLHGPWLITTGEGAPSAVQVAVSPLRYETHEIALDNVAGIQELKTRLIEGLDEIRDSIQKQDPAVRLVSSRLTLTGRCPLTPNQIDEVMTQLQSDPREYDKLTILVNDWLVRVRPSVDLQELRHSRGLIGELAQLIFQLESDAQLTESETALLSSIQQATEDVHRASVFTAISELQRESSDPRRLAAEQGWQLLEELLNQRTPGND